MIKKDAILIGSGQAANPLSLKLSEAGWQVALIEKSEDHLGGTCVNVGCTPSKTLIGSARAMYDINHSKQHGISVATPHLNFGVTQERKKKIVDDPRNGLKKRLDEAQHLEVVYGKATFKKDKIVSVLKTNGDTEDYTAPLIFIDAGSRPRIPDISGLDQITWYDSTGILELKEVPEKLVIVGGGYIGLEIGQMYHRFGSEVTILERSEQIMSDEDSDIAAGLQDILAREGISIQCNSPVSKVSADGDRVKVAISTAEGDTEISCTHFLIATGRTSNADELHVKAAGIAVDEKGYIKVNDKLQTNVEGVYALGDIKGGPAFTHIAYNDYIIVYENLLQKKNTSKKDRPIPYCMYTDPQLGRIGITEKDAKKEGLDYTIVTIPGSRITRGIESGKTQGPWKAVIDKKTRQILGAAIVSTEGGEIASVLQMAMEGGITADHLAKAIFSHPSYAESINTLFMELDK